ncbi:MAG: phosphoribosylanthranilate isomerase [Gammaproteobacteria bacterium]|nr:phosphoribosylanthranilate isomerase [Gammaproteobacteria bacterium]
MQRTRIKICGITRPEDALSAALGGADAIGMVFYSASPRAVDADQASRIMRSLPPFVTTVGVFVDPDPDEVRSILRRVDLDLLQFHGAEAPEFCAGFDRCYIKAVRVRPGVDIPAIEKEHAGAVALLLDTYTEDSVGGTGREFDWGLIPSGLRKPVILAGGLTAENVGAAIRRASPFAVDVSGGVEAEKGRKDPGRISAFVAAVAEAGSHRFASDPA